MTPDLQAIIAVPEDTSFDALPESVKGVFDQLVVKWTDFPSIPYGGERLVLAHLLSPSETPVESINGLIQQYGLSWTLKRVQAWRGTQEVDDEDTVTTYPPTVYLAESIDDWLPDLYDYDSEGEPIPGTARKPDPSSWCIFGGAANWA